MQKFALHPSWEKTLSSKDRQIITEQFENVARIEKPAIIFLWKATNYKNDLLITSLIHNPSTSDLFIEGLPISYTLENGKNITNCFHLPFHLPPKTTMPWTFIFTPAKQTIALPVYCIQAMPEKS